MPSSGMLRRVAVVRSDLCGLHNVSQPLRCGNCCTHFVLFLVQSHICSGVIHQRWAVVAACCYDCSHKTVCVSGIRSGSFKYPKMMYALRDNINRYRYGIR
jgi:hypothetical protein